MRVRDKKTGKVYPSVKKVVTNEKMYLPGIAAEDIKCGDRIIYNPKNGHVRVEK